MTRAPTHTCSAARVKMREGSSISCIRSSDMRAFTCRGCLSATPIARLGSVLAIWLKEQRCQRLALPIVYPCCRRDFVPGTSRARRPS